MSSSSKYLSAEERRAMTVRAVLELAAVHNPSEITTTDIARRMGLSQGGVFRHFSTKDEIWRAVMEWVATELYSRVSAAAQAAASPLASLEAMFHAHVGFALEYPGVPRMLFAELQKAESTPAKIAVVTLLERYGRLLAQTLEQGKEAGQIDAAIPVPTACSLFVGAIQGLIIKGALLGDFELMRTNASETYGLFLRAVRKDP
jgi:AcrR family transcriptional regulator